VSFVVNGLMKGEIEKPSGQFLGLLALWCASDRCGMAGNDEDHGKSRRPGADDRG
jgi:hypothetical protein